MSNRVAGGDDLRAWLLAGDPAAADPGLNPEEATRIRRQIVAAVCETPARRSLLLLAALAAAAALALLLLLPREPAPTRPSGNPQASDLSGPRQIQFTTERGTRIFWTLDPDFELRPSSVKEKT